MTDQSKMQYLRGCFDSLCVFRGMLEDRVFRLYRDLVAAAASPGCSQERAANLYGALYYEMLSGGRHGLGRHMEHLVLYRKNPFACESEHAPFGEIDANLRAAAAADLQKIRALCHVTSGEIKQQLRLRGMDGEMVNLLPDWNEEPLYYLDADDCLERLAAFHRLNSTGKFARYRQFLWDRGALRPVTSPDPIRLADFIGYETQRAQVVDNTRRLLEGRPANNVLLYGDRGTGKSSTVKAIGNEFRDQGLRMIELPKNQMTDFSRVLDAIGRSSCKFIIFIDDLAFEDHAQDYTMLKALLEGGLESRPDNCVVYATSNRRNLIKETFAERAGLTSSDANEEVHARDTMQEKLSLADRFGLRVTFSAPGQQEYLEIVRGLARQRGLSLPDDELRRLALVWEMNNNGKSPRTARQFIDGLC